MPFDYFYNVPIGTFPSYPLPHALFTNTRYRGLSLGAKAVYMLMLDRLEDLTDSDNRRDEHGKVYIIFLIDEVIDMLKVSKKTASKYMAELDAKSGVGLIERVKIGHCHPDRIYVLINLLHDQEAPST